jgi:hypothetical protein
MDWKGCGRKQSWATKVLFQHMAGGTEEKKMRNLSQDNQSPGQDLNPRPPEYGAEVLTTQLQCSVLINNTIMWQS